MTWWQWLIAVILGLPTLLYGLGILLEFLENRKYSKLMTNVQRFEWRLARRVPLGSGYISITAKQWLEGLRPTEARRRHYAEREAREQAWYQKKLEKAQRKDAQR